jgi:hypothetical protein
MAFSDSLRSLASRIARCESSGGGTKAEVEALRREVADLQRQVSSLQAANGYLRDQNASLLQDLGRRAGALVIHSGSWRNSD